MTKLIIAIPAFNEEDVLHNNVLKVLNFCQNHLKLDWQLVIVDNGSVDQTAEIGKNLAKDYNKIKYLHLAVAGKGLAIKSGWQSLAADFYLFMDADLATDLSAVPLAITKLTSGADLVLGSRFHSASRVNRSLARKMFSFGYRLTLRLFLNTKISDAPCGFKAINNRVKENILPQVYDEKWFFDSELAILAEYNNFRIVEIPVVWQDPRVGGNKSKVKVLSLSLAYLQEVLKLRKRLKKYE